MLKIPKNPELVDLEVEFEEDVAERLDAFVEYTQEVQGQAHATCGLCVRAIMEKDLSSTRWEEFHAWRRDEAADAEPPAADEEAKGEKEESSEASEEASERVESPKAKEEAEGDDGGQRSKTFGAEGADATGPVKVEDKRESEADESTSRRSASASPTGSRRIKRETKS